ncbi:carbohydrate ABC transporter substrate-binding protein, CUT1 family [Sanguibacter gelidistatuariae]|uniref:Carbohydrate ABC transporter substrate-binding protein, CUT1 family n=1 Tax=Sanguibacter gelidistatuariae TaxID=1814289 RepID=A0A1G6HKW5_9MICO|nr:sugar ABC transporter substrate-binding protein [Sanguibacter gelidistatuariae]SDB94545.1 carbohydrate ABC transporter substrate-binding protein, CUT1 family [Sanguibacter gelidistatuariae]
MSIHRPTPPTTRHSRLVRGTSLLAAAALLAACSPSGDGSSAAADDSGTTTVTFRLWDEQVAKAYEKSFAAFTAQNPDITVDVNVVPWASYWDQLPIDVGAGTIDDIFWLNSSNVARYAAAGQLVDITDALGSASDGWQASVVDQYTIGGSLWGVPQLSDANGVFYNADLLDAAGIDPADLAGLSWVPGAGPQDTLLPALQALTLDSSGHTAADPAFDASAISQFGYNAGLDLQAIYYPFVGSNGGAWQASDSDAYVFADDPKSVEAIQYVVDLINAHHVSPSAADTNDNGDFSRDQFLQGKLAIFQSGTYNLANVRDGADFTWGLTTVPQGPAGSVTVANGIIAAASSASDHKDAVTKVLAWIGSDEGASYIAADGSAFPAVTGAQQAYLDYWAGQGVDVTPFLDAAEGATIGAPHGAEAGPGANAAAEVLKEVFLGRLDVATGLSQAQEAANTAIK